MTEPFEPGNVHAVFLTFRTYGTWLHGTAPGSVDRDHRLYGEPLLGPSRHLVRKRQKSMKHQAVVLSDEARRVVDGAIREVCRHRDWPLHALSVRTNHVHAVLYSRDSRPEAAMVQLKAWATRRLRESGLSEGQGTVWAVHGSTRYLWSEEAVFEASNYVQNRQ